MATDLTDLAGRIYLDVSMVAQKAADLSTPQDSLAYRPNIPFTFGVGNGQVNQEFHDQFTIAPSGNHVIDLTTDLNIFGLALNFDYIKAVIIYNASALADIGVGNAALPFGGWRVTATSVENIDPLALDVHASMTEGWSVSSGVDDEIKILNNDATNAATVDVIILGVVSA